MTEEDIRGKILLPFLTDIGFNISEISLERSFKIRIGKTQHALKGRSDILCSRNGKNLFVIELKNDSISISQNDIDQGISYARALDNIAPFTIITNGRVTRIFDSISKAELTGRKISDVSAYWKNGCTLSTDVDLKVRYEALLNFVSFSDENLKVFCSNQVQDRMGPIIGDIDSPSAKFVKGLHIQRNNLQVEFNDFINSDASVFGIVGSAGVGKTNALCSLALNSLDDNFVFFYNAAIINKPPLEHVAQDLNGLFSSKSESDLVLKKLNELGRSINKKVLLFIDAIDESIHKEIAVELSEIALRIRNLDQVKLCISCKDNIWLNVIKINGTPTHLFEELNKFRYSEPMQNSSPGYLLNDFSDEELSKIIPVYKNAFGFKGEISVSLLKELKNGFFLRIFSEVYSQKHIPEKIDDKHLIKAYLTQSLDKTNIGVQNGLRILSEIGRIVKNYKYTGYEAFEDDGVEVEKLLDALNYQLDKGLPEDLFARNILTRSNKNDSYNISFYYSKIRDYIICFHAYKLHELSDQEFSEVLESFFENYIGQSAISFYIENANENHKHALIQFKKNKALSYAACYNAYLDKNFGKFKQLFSPKTIGEIGVVLPIDVLKDDGYALRPITPEMPDRIIHENIEINFSGNLDRTRLNKLGVGPIYGSNFSLLGQDQNKVVGRRVFEQLQDIIQKGRLSAYDSDILLLEQVALIVYYHSKQLGLDFKRGDLDIPRLECIYPIDLQDIQNRAKRFRAYQYFKRKNVPHGEIESKIEEALEKNVDIPKSNTYGDFPPLEELTKIIGILQKKGYRNIPCHHLPYPDIPVPEARQHYQKSGTDTSQRRIFQYSSNQAKQYIEHFFKHLENCYREFVEELFPTFKDGFSFYTTMPHEYIFYLEDSDILKWGSFGYRSSKDGQIRFHFKENFSWAAFDNIFKDDGIFSLQGFSLDDFLHSDDLHPIKTIDKINTPEVDDSCVIRNWVYKLLRDDMRELFKENGSNI